MSRISRTGIVFLLPIMSFFYACHGGGDEHIAGPVQQAKITDSIYTQIKSNSDAAALFAAVEGEKCNVTIYRMSYATHGGDGEAVTSSGVLMLPSGDDAERCQGERPVLLHAHGTADEKNYDLSQFIVDSNNAAAGEATLLLALFASQGYAVIAPNYAGYADSDLDYHPFLDEQQQSGEMIDALEYARQYVDNLGGSFSDQLFITGISQGGYVAMATHKALQAKGETVTASAPISGPYAMLDFFDTIAAGYVNGGATTFAPMYLTAMRRAKGIFPDLSDLYSDTYKNTADNALPVVGGHDKAVTDGKLPETAIFSGAPSYYLPLPENINPAFHTLAFAAVSNQLGYGSTYLLNDAVRAAYLEDMQNNPEAPDYDLRKVIHEGDLRNWHPQAPVLLCGTDDDPVVYFSNTIKMKASLPSSGFDHVVVLNLNDEPTGDSDLFAPVKLQYEAGKPDVLSENYLPWLQSVHGGIGASLCGLAAAGFFAQILAASAQ